MRSQLARSSNVARGARRVLAVSLSAESASAVSHAFVTKRDRTVATVGRQDATSRALDGYVHRSAVPRLGD
jgi:hypothetical protein